MRTLDISSKETYLQWVSDWKEEYKKTSARLREIRIELSKPHPVKEVKWAYGSYFISEVAGLQSEQHSLRSWARTLLEVRAEGKKQSWAAKQELLCQSQSGAVEMAPETPTAENQM